MTTMFRRLARKSRIPLGGEQQAAEAATEIGADTDEATMGDGMYSVLVWAVGIVILCAIGAAVLS